MTTLADIAGEIQTGDPFVCSGDGGVFTNIIKVATGSELTHVGAWCRLDDFPAELLNVDSRARVLASGIPLLVVESTTLSPIEDVKDGVVVGGVSAVPAAERVAGYEGKVAWRPIRAERTPEVLRRSAEIILQCYGIPYEAGIRGVIELALAAFDGRTSLTQNQPDAHSLFCSEWLTKYLRYIRFFLPRRIGAEGLEGEPPNEFVPVDYGGDELPLADGVTIDPLMWLTA